MLRAALQTGRISTEGKFELLVASVDHFRIDANQKIDPSRRSELGQFMTPPATARLMASMFQANHRNLTLLDAGAGIGSLTTAFVAETISREQKPESIHAIAYEIDPQMCHYLAQTLNRWRVAQP